MRLTMNSEAINHVAETAWADTMRWLQRQFIQEFTENKWAWPTGQSPRDIIDTTRLRNSTMTPEQARVNERVSIWSWNVEYAMAVHEGATFISGPLSGRTFPPRRWTEQPLKKMGRYYQSRFKNHLRSLP